MKGSWRQWEAFDCPDLDSIHNDGERHLPYTTLFSNSLRNKLAAWAANQQPNGMLPEQVRGSGACVGLDGWCPSKSVCGELVVFACVTSAHCVTWHAVSLKCLWHSFP